MISDADAPRKLVEEALRLIGDGERLAKIGEDAKKLAQLDSADRIADEVLKLVEKK
jgi:UDP-N-acetylglucosamine--N-acetylmuramyl-(pentapeptide) pyrophosphoryl-undecaprenol N-acetylglucosamine transferase